MKTDVSAFRNRYDDLIKASPSPAGVVSFRNVAGGHVAELELSARAAARTLDIEGSYMYLNTSQPR